MRQPRVIPLTFSYLEMVEREVVTKMESPVDLLAILRRCGEDLRSRLEKKGGRRGYLWRLTCQNGCPR